MSTETLLAHKSMVTNEYFGLTTTVKNDSETYLENINVTFTMSNNLKPKGKFVNMKASGKNGTHFC